MASLRRALSLTVAALLAVPMGGLVHPSAAAAATPDVTEPQLVAFEVSPLSVDIADAAQTISVRARITDDQAGTETPTMLLSSQSTSQDEGFGPMRLVEGDVLDGWYEWSATIPVGAAPGNWDVVLYPLRDARGNGGDFGPPAHFPSVVNVVNPAGADTSPPSLIEFEVSPTAVDVSTTSQTVSVRARITDDQSGTTAPTMSLASSTTAQSVGFGSMRRVSGSALDGWWEWSAIVPTGAAPGTWDVVLHPLGDERGNEGTFGPPSNFETTVLVINGAGSDVTPPQLVSFEVTPRTIDVADSSQTVSVRARITDNLSGALPPTMTLSSETTDQSAGFGSMHRVSGNALDGWYEWSAVVPQGAAPGPWSARLFPLEDTRGNSGSFGPPAGFDGNVNVVNFSGDTTAPRLLELSVGPEVYYAGDAEAQLTVRASIADDASGATAPKVTISPVSPASPGALIEEQLTLVEGDANNGVFEWTGSLDTAGHTGLWEVELEGLEDVRGNAVALTSGNVAQFNVAAGVKPVAASAPQNVVATPGNASATVNWDAPGSTGGTAITSYVVSAAPGGRTVTVPASSTTATVTGLANGTEYRFTVVAVNAVGNSPASAASAVVTPRTVASAPQQVSAVPGSASATVTWTAPVSTGGAPITSYVVTAAPGGSTATVSASSITATVTGLTNGTAYRFAVVAVNAAGNSPASTASAAVTPRTAASAPQNVVATPGNASAIVHWDAPSSTGGAAVTSYVVTAAPGGNTATVPATSTTATVTGLTNGTAYGFTVVAVNDAGNSAASTASASVTPKTTASAPKNVAATPGNVSATVSWDAPDSTGGAAITSYVVTAAPGGHTVTVPASSTTATMTGLTNGTAYRFTVVAVNAAGNSAPSTASVSVTPRTTPGAPTEVEAAPGDASATVTWTAPASNGGVPITSFVVSATPGNHRVTVPATDTSTNVTGLINGTDYRFTVAAVNAAGTSPDSAAAEATPLAPLERIAGSSRFETAAAISEQFPVGVETVYIASGANFPDALAGAARAGQEGAPVLLALRDSVPAATTEALARLKPQNVVLLGGEPTLSRAVATQLAPFGTVTRIAGANRYATSAEISRGFEPGVETVYVASGVNFPDALAGASLAGATGSPVLLTHPSQLSDSVREALERLNPDRIVVLGGTPSVSQSVLSSLNGIAPATRIAGANRFLTASMIAAEFPESDRVFVASGQKFPDALAGAALAGAQGAPVLLALRDTLPDATADAVERSGARQVVVLGDANSINDGVATQLREIVER